MGELKKIIEKILEGRFLDDMAKLKGDVFGNNTRNILTNYSQKINLGQDVKKSTFEFSEDINVIYQVINDVTYKFEYYLTTYAFGDRDEIDLLYNILTTNEVDLNKYLNFV